MYIPTSDYSHLTNDITNRTLFPTGTLPNIEKTGIRSIYWDEVCSEVLKTMPDYSMSLDLIDVHTATDDTNKFTITLTKERMLVDGKHFGYDTRCYMPIFATWDLVSNT